MDISFDTKTLFDSATFLTIAEENASVRVGEGDETLQFNLIFKKDKEKDQELNSRPIDDHTLELTLVNWAETLGNALIKPIEIGQIRGKKAYINLFVKSTGSRSTVKEITFSIYLGESVKDGED